ncbi:hypothetical protein G7092_17030 [Mucilaginibacter sp. HC2]|uniref:hypothetical protein n=1 Tax=Mucilaginibacter TaxID=423349 RepID=UPI000DCC9A49|nr:MULTISPECIES: hypothetical protein [Mucilaginibacter]NHA05517.1 hypothetical protein [Mucilaginibacter inviolabilis]QTE35325.1 hypothetical protein J3L18_19505 [Mucilaginibacter gossypii]RAV59472.1 hypothetical protein DIU36_06485 [Mucilaginibacter rubeus]
MKNFKKIALGLLVGALAIGFSSFTTVKSSLAPFHNKALKAHMITDDFLLQNQGVAGVFAQDNSYDSGNCATSETLRCGYSVTATGKTNIPNQSTYSSSDITNYLSHNWITPAPGSSNALYN